MATYGREIALWGKRTIRTWRHLLHFDGERYDLIEGVDEGAIEAIFETSLKSPESTGGNNR
jgi:hypothetical protein